ncbi:hypothetical protein ACFLXT_04295 [Chloroflexota bacterium]
MSIRKVIQIIKQKGRADKVMVRHAPDASSASPKPSALKPWSGSRLGHGTTINKAPRLR